MIYYEMFSIFSQTVLLSCKQHWARNEDLTSSSSVYPWCMIKSSRWSSTSTPPLGAWSGDSWPYLTTSYTLELMDLTWWSLTPCHPPLQRSRSTSLDGTPMQDLFWTHPILFAMRFSCNKTSKLYGTSTKDCDNGHSANHYTIRTSSVSNHNNVTIIQHRATHHIGFHCCSYYTTTTLAFRGPHGTIYKNYPRDF